MTQRTLTLQTVEGPRRRVVPRLRRLDGGAARAGASPLPLNVLLEGLERRGKKFLKRLKEAAQAGVRDTASAVHDLRTASRHLLAVLEGLKRFVAGKAVRRPRRRIEKLLDRLGPVRDVTAQREMLQRIGSRNAIVHSLASELAARDRRMARKARRRLGDVPVRRVRRDLRRLARTARGRHASDADERRRARDSARRALERLREARAAVDPNDSKTLHHMRIALKRFRYLMEELRPFFPGVPARDLATLHQLQTSLGDLHDLDTLTATIAQHLEKRAPARASEAAPALQHMEERHAEILLSCLRALEPVLRPWEHLLIASGQ
ncbi:MAG TPA: CHAD domain-containing protein [Candidatus Binatia bacterium]